MFSKFSYNYNKDIKAMNALKYDSSRLDRITVKMLKLNIYHLSQLLLYLFNLAVIMSALPDSFKFLIITAIHKISNKTKIENYCSIS